MNQAAKAEDAEAAAVKFVANNCAFIFVCLGFAVVELWDAQIVILYLLTI